MYAKNKIKGHFLYEVFGFPIVSVFLVWFCVWLAERTRSSIGVMGSFMFIFFGWLFAVLGCFCLGRAVDRLITQLHAERSIAEERHEGYISSAFTRIKNLDPEDQNRKEQFRKFLSVLLSARNAGLSWKMVNSYLLDTLKCRFLVREVFEFDSKYRDGKTIEPYGDIWLFYNRNVPPGSDINESCLGVTSIKLF